MATIAKQPKSSRFDMRLTADQRSEIERAAALKGKSLTQWALDNLLESARRDIEEEEITRLDREAFEYFVAALEEPMAAEADDLMARKPVWE